MKGVFAVLGLLAGLIGTYYTYRQFQHEEYKERATAPEVVVCLKGFSYMKTAPNRFDSVLIYTPKVNASFKLVNRGATQVTVNRVEFNPVGATKNGDHRGMSIEQHVNVVVPAYGTVDVNHLEFSSTRSVPDLSWVDVLEYINVKAHWAGQAGPMLSCVSMGRGDWGCGQGPGNPTLIDSACH